MKKFIVNIASIILATFGVLALLHIHHAYREYNRFVLPAGKSVICVSNSHTQCALTDKDWPEFINLSSSASNTWIWLWKLQTLMSRNPDNLPNCLILAYGVPEAAHIDKEDVEAASFTRLFPMPLFGNCYPYKVLNSICTQPFLDTFFSIRGIRNTWVDPPPPDSNKDLDVEYTIKRHFGTAQSSSEHADQIYQDNFNKIIELALAHNMKIVIVSTPCHPQYRRLVPPFFIKKRDETIKRILEQHPEIEYFDFYSSEVFHREDFRDANHLSSNGRTKFTKLLKTTLGYD